MNKEFNLSLIEQTRIKYLPKELKTLIIAEAPPDSFERFFYFENVKTADYLFIAIAEVLYPEAKALYMKHKRDSEIKRIILEQFQSDGYYLLDLFENPKSVKIENESIAISKLINKIKKLANASTSIILVKANVYDIAFFPLKSKFNVIDKRISFPSCGNQRKFFEQFSEVIEQINK